MRLSLTVSCLDPVPLAMQVEIANAVDALRVAVIRLDDMSDSFDAIPESRREFIDVDDVFAARTLCEHFVRVFQEVHGSEPSIPARAFATLRKWENRDPRNIEAIEGFVLSAKLAGRCLRAAVHASFECSPEWSDLDSLLHSAADAVGMYEGLLHSVSFGLDDEEILDAILAGEPIPSRAVVARLDTPDDCFAVA